MIDARNHHVRFVLEQSGNREVDAVRWCAVDGINIRIRPLNTQRAIQRQRVACATSISVRRDHGGGAQIAQMARQTQKALGPVAVIVAYQDIQVLDSMSQSWQ